MKSFAAIFAAAASASVADDCKTMVASPGSPWNLSSCQGYCDFYSQAAQKPWCPDQSSGSAVADCVAKNFSFCSKTSGGGSVPTTPPTVAPPTAPVVPPTVPNTPPTAPVVPPQPPTAPVVPPQPPTVPVVPPQPPTAPVVPPVPSVPATPPVLPPQPPTVPVVPPQPPTAPVVPPVPSVPATPPVLPPTAPVLPPTAPTAPVGGSGADPKVFHYFPAWGVWTRDYNAWWLPAGKASGMLYSFFDVNADCECLTTDEGADFNKGASWGGVTNQIHGSNNFQQSWDWKGCAGNRSHIQALKQAHPDYEVLMSLGGWTLSSHFHKCLKTPANREKLAESIRATASKYGFFSGIDIDWEYPGKFDDNGNERPLTDVHVDVRNWADFLDLLKAKMPEMHHSSALGMSPDLINKEFETTDFCRVLNHLNYVFTMSYDFYGAWSRTTSHNAPMQNDPANPSMVSGFSVVESMENLLTNWNAKCKSQYGSLEHKIVMGLPAYGRTWSGVPSTEVKPGKPGLYSQVTGSVIDGPGSITDAAGVGYGSIDFWDVKTNYLNKPGVTRHWDEVSQVPYLIGERTDGKCCLATESGNDSMLCSSHDCKRPGQFFISYDDEESIRIKSQYAKSKGFAGLMFWEASGDREWDLLNAVYEGWGSATRVPAKYSPVSSVPEFCGPEDEIIPGLPQGTGCYMHASWYHNNTCSQLASSFDSSFERLPHKDRAACCAEVNARVGGFGTKEELKGELNAGKASAFLCPNTVVSEAGAGCKP